MTTYFEEDYESFDDGPGATGTLMNWAGALLSLALIIGLAVWGYQLLVRDVTGVPVVRALEGPMRVAPEDPGGLRAEYQELTVTRVASDGAEEAPTERVVLAPPPVRLEEEDQPIAALIDDTPTPTAPEAPVAAPVEETAVAEEAQDPQSAIEAAIAEALGATEPVTPEVSERPVGALLAGGVQRSPRPFARPARAVVTQASASVNPAPVSGVAVAGEVPAEEIPPGTRLVQLGAYPSIDRAREAWSALDGRFGEYLDGKSRVVQEASAGGSTFYRLRAMGFEDLSDARRFCAVLVAENANCIPVIRR
ncbi:MAG: SPOR domain-containing protein [Pseudomonadota bacterium]